MVKCDDIVIIEYGGRRPGLSIAPVDVEYDKNRTEEYNSKNLNITPTYPRTKSG